MGVRVALAALIVLLAVAVSGAPAAPLEDVPPDAIALVAGEPVPKAAFDAYVERVKRVYAIRGRDFPAEGSPEFDELKSEIVVLLVERVMMRQKAGELGIVVTEADVDTRIADVKRTQFAGDDERFRDALAKEGLTEDDYRADLRAAMVARAVYRLVTANVTAAEAEIVAYYRAHREDFVRPAQRLVQHVMVETKARIDWIYAQLQGGASFDALARRWSRDPGTRAQGGRLLIGRGQTVEPFDRIAFSLRTGTFSRPFRTRFGWHVVKALSPIRPERLVPLGEVRGPIRAKLVQQKKAEAMGEWVEALRAEYAGKVVYAPGFEPTPRP